MQVTKTSEDGLKQGFTVVISAADIAAKVDARLVDVGTSVKVPGFRPGKVPMALLKKKYGPSVMGEVLEELVNSGAESVIKDNGIRPALQPKIEIASFPEGGDLTFTVEVEALPSVTLQDFAGISLEKPVAVVDEAEVEKILADIAARRESSEPHDEGRVAENGDIAVIDFLGKVDGVPFDGGKGEAYSLKLGSGSFIPGFEDQVVGLTVGGEKVITVTFPADYGSDALAGKEATFDIKVHELRRAVPSAIDDDLAKGFGLADLAALKDSLRTEITNDYASLSRAHAKRALLDKLADSYDFVLPAGLVDGEFDGIWKQLQDDKAKGNLDPSDADKSDDELKAEYRAIAERRVRLGLVLSEIGRQNNITITPDDLNKAVLNEARRYPGQEHLVFQYFQKNADALNSLRAPIYEEKTVDFVLERASIVEKTVSVEDLRKEPGVA